MLRAEQTRVTVPDDARHRLAERLAATVPGFGPLGVQALTSAPPGGAGVLTGVTAKVLLALALAAGGAAAVKAVGHTSLAGAHVHAIPLGTREIAPHAARVLVEDRDQAIVAPPAPLPEVAPVPAAVPPSLSPAASLREERRLLELARDAIIRDEPAEALGPAEIHATRFPRGVLAEERDALRIRALAHLGRLDEARTRLTEMRVAHPHSFLLEGAAADVGTIP
jgi:hypothetical protein